MKELKTETVTVPMTLTMYDALCSESDRADLSVAHLVRRAIAAMLGAKPNSPKS